MGKDTSLLNKKIPKLLILSLFLASHGHAAKLCPEVEKDSGKVNFSVVLGKGFTNSQKIFEFPAQAFKYTNPQATFKQALTTGLTAKMKSEIKDPAKLALVDQEVASFMSALPMNAAFENKMDGYLAAMLETFQAKCCPLSKIDIALKVEIKKTGYGGANMPPQPIVRMLTFDGCPNNPPNFFDGTESQRNIESACLNNDNDTNGVNFDVSETAARFGMCFGAIDNNYPDWKEGQRLSPKDFKNH